MTKKKTLQDAQNLALVKNGDCLSTEYINSGSKLLWQCEEKHQWLACYESIKNGSWCPYCVRVAKLNIEAAQKVAQLRGGKCLSEVYVNAHSKLLWECPLEHRWEASYDLVTHNRWCPYCKTSRSENICRIYLETIFNLPFPKFYPNWLKNDNGCQLELDGYCSELGIGFEYNGKQHYQEIKLYNITSEKLERIKLNDQIKKELCQENNVKLIIIPENNIKNMEEDLLLFLRKEFINLNIPIKNFPSEIKISEETLYLYSIKYTRKYDLKYFQNIAKEKGGELLSSIFISVHHKMQWKCGCGYIWLAPGKHIKDGTWCPICTRNVGSIAKMQKRAAEFGGECLSDVYINNNTNLTWKCKNGHIFEKRPRELLAGAWCNDSECKKYKRIKKA